MKDIKDSRGRNIPDYNEAINIVINVTVVTKPRL